uniref:Calcyclin-binding protein n=1 Tax=Attheya septentrionalis TaxID=420275 RepID=A0A7S2UKZ4_9STRA|mmetsp:Transcript_2786/g.5066  ORF Transcript_2786/g.5066 Transcript_2786/m.5066 type:complete len:288 (+) Transcript_2786:156-1019(+)|eukprot:CAMPEP_0198304348 /NCGR_PEP_ID=MMETSP1449-20131203/57355_1 /TAXON_ID=420275 /ORGANISM="Attheya septentrionalis, Strain CCMP2084" /LENGTH=287 /DNA_ID=CAMNT_0044006869 /DNA_START=68 /DNA_END=931 /DNA_ORIENTATION=+
MVEIEQIQEDSFSPSEERIKDAEAIEQCMASVTRPTARVHLEALVKKLRRDGAALQRVEQSRAATAAAETTTNNDEPVVVETTPTPASTPTKTPIPPPKAAAPSVASTRTTTTSQQYRTIDKFLFDAGGYNSATVTLYVPLPSVGSISKDLVTCHFTPNSFDLIVRDLMGKSYRLLKDNLEHDIVVDKCKIIIKAEKVILKLAKTKSEYGSYDMWTNLVAKEKKSSSGSKKKDDPSASIMNLMKDMYDSGDDQMKKMIGETMLKQQRGEMGKNSPGLGDLDDDFSKM